MSYKEAWKKILAKLEAKMSVVYFDLWIKTLDPLKILEGKIVLLAQNENVRTLILDKFESVLIEAIKDTDMNISGVKIIIPEEKDQVLGKVETVTKESEDESKIDAIKLNPKFNFESFVVGKSNEAMHSAALQVAENPGRKFNPLFIYGGTGLGKTHIMHSICNFALVAYPEKKTLYVTSEKFLNEYKEAARLGREKANKFRDYYRKVDILVIDDIQFFAGKPGVQEELFHTFNALYGDNKQIVLAADKAPKEINDLEDRLKSRFSGGVVVDVVKPDYDTRMKILKQKAFELKAKVPIEVFSKIAKQSNDSNVRELEGVLNKLVLYSGLRKKPPSLDMVTEVKIDYPEETNEEILLQKVIYAVCEYFSIRPEEIFGTKRSRELSEPRHICMYLINDIVGIPLAKIGERFSNRDHTSVLFARNKVAELLKTDKKTIQTIKAIREAITQKK